jgi:hypothetical protein
VNQLFAAPVLRAGIAVTGFTDRGD